MDLFEHLHIALLQWLMVQVDLRAYIQLHSVVVRSEFNELWLLPERQYKSYDAAVNMPMHAYIL